MTGNRTAAVILAALIATGIGGCEPTPTGPSAPLESLPRQLSAAEQAVLWGSNAFAFDLFATVNSDEADNNVFISPLSVSMALGMTMNGARGRTFDEMRTVLGFDGLSQPEINDAYRELTNLLLGLDPAVEMAIGNSIWYRQEFPFDPSFFDTVEQSFGARVEALDFADEGSVDRINDWVDEATRGRISTIVDVIDSDDVMFLVNAIYFRGDWRQRFDPAKTHPDTFIGPDGGEIPVRMMTALGTFDYAAGPDYEVVELPYGNGAFAMTLVLPTPGTNVNALPRSLDDQTWASTLDGMSRREIEISLPRLEIEYQRGLMDALRALGMTTAFIPRGADFTGMSAEAGHDLFISAVKHKSYVAVDERGTEAAGVTSVGVSVTSAGPPPLHIRFDRPFIFAIRERFSGAILFVGKIVAPSE